MAKRTASSCVFYIHRISQECNEPEMCSSLPSHGEKKHHEFTRYEVCQQKFVIASKESVHSPCCLCWCDTKGEIVWRSNKTLDETVEQNFAPDTFLSFLQVFPFKVAWHDSTRVTRTSQNQTEKQRAVHAEPQCVQWENIDQRQFCFNHILSGSKFKATVTPWECMENFFEMTKALMTTLQALCSPGEIYFIQSDPLQTFIVASCVFLPHQFWWRSISRW